MWNRTAGDCKDDGRLQIVASGLIGRIRSASCLFLLPVLFFASARCVAQQRPPANSRSSSHGRLRAPRSAHYNPAHLTQQALADMVLADVMGRMWAQSDRHFDAGEFNHSVNMNRILVQGDPKNVEAYSNAAWLLWSTDRGSEAVDFLKQGLQANSSTFYMYDELGDHYLYRVKDPVAATPYFEKAVRFTCPFSTWHSLAHCYEKTQKWDKAVYAWEMAAKYKDNPVAASHLVRAKLQLKQSQNP